MRRRSAMPWRCFARATSSGRGSSERAGVLQRLFALGPIGADMVRGTASLTVTDEHAPWTPDDQPPIADRTA